MLEVVQGRFRRWYCDSDSIDHPTEQLKAVEDCVKLVVGLR